MKDNLASYFCGELLYLIDLQLTELASRFLKATPLTNTRFDFTVTIVAGASWMY